MDSEFPTVAIVNGACPFKGVSKVVDDTEPAAKKQRLEDTALKVESAPILSPQEHTATPATHFALAAGPASDTAVLLPFAQHRWHSRLVAALRDDARETHGGDLSTAATFVLVALPEQARPKVFDLLVKVLELRGRTFRLETGLPDAIPEEYKKLAVDIFPLCQDVKSLDPDSAASMCQLCRVGEFLQLSIAVDLACSFIAPWVAAVKSNPVLTGFAYQLLKRVLAEDMLSATHPPACRLHYDRKNGKPPLSRPIHADSALLDGLEVQGTDMALGYRPIRRIPEMFFDVLPPGIIPGSVMDSRLQCYLNDGNVRQPVYCGNAKEPAFLYVTCTTTATENTASTLYFRDGPASVDHFTRLAGTCFHSVRLPADLPIDVQMQGVIVTRALHIIVDHANDNNLVDLSKAWTNAMELDFSQSTLTTIPPHCFSACPRLQTVWLPPTLREVKEFAFPKQMKFAMGLSAAANVSPFAFPAGCTAAVSVP